MAEARMKTYCNAKRIVAPLLERDDLVYVKLAKLGYDWYHFNNQTELGHRRAEPSRVVEKISDMKYRIELPTWLKWKPESSIENLEPVFVDSRPEKLPGPIDERERYIIKAIVDHRRKNGKMEYKSKWM